MFFDTLDKFYIEFIKMIDIYDYYYNKVSHTFFCLYSVRLVYALRV